MGQSEVEEEISPLNIQNQQSHHSVLSNEIRGGQAIDAHARERLIAKQQKLLDQFTFWKIIFHFNIATIASCVAMSLMCLTFKEPIFALMLGAKNLSVTQIGLVFSIDTITYTLTSMSLNFVKEERNGMKYGLLMFGGLLFFGLSMLMQGPASFLPE